MECLLLSALQDQAAISLPGLCLSWCLHLVSAPGLFLPVLLLVVLSSTFSKVTCTSVLISGPASGELSLSPPLSHGLWNHIFWGRESEI